ncbi:MAG: YfhO family protein [Clostridia bacterium]|nr:YfhO family protein [Clostridia bacterium]
MKCTDKCSRNFLSYLIPPAITLLFLLITFFVKDIFPFGAETIAKAHDSADLAQTYVPYYTHIWDFLHGKTSLFFSFLSGGGISMMGNISFGALLSPLNLFFYLVPRGQIMEYMSIFLMIKTALMSFAAYCYFKKRFNCPTFYSVLFSVAYALSGYVMMYYVHIMWLDSAIVFPFLLLSAENVLRGKKLYPFVIFFTLTLVLNLYIAFMVSLFLLLAGGAYLFLVTPKEIRGISSLRFIFGAAGSVLLSAFINVPAAMQLLFSKRASLVTGVDAVIFNTSFSVFSHKLFVFAGLGFALTLLIRFFFKQEKDIKLKWFCALAILIPALPVIFENINLVWHLGSYFGPANRMGFISIFIVLAVCAYAVSKYGDGLKRTAQSKLFNLFLIGCNVLAAVSITAIFYRLDGDINQIIRQEPKLFFVMGISALAFVLALMIKHKKIRYACISSVFSVLTLCLCLGFVSPDGRYIKNKNADAYIGETLSLREQEDIENATFDENALERIKAFDNQFGSNYSFILSKAALSGWSHSLQMEIQAIARSFGYTRCELRLSDNGGTLFSDALLAFKKTVSRQELSDKLYTLQSEGNEFDVYKNNYTMPFSVLADSSIMNIGADYRKDAFAFSNEVYSALTADKEPLFEELTDNGVTSGNTVSFEIPVTGEQVLYYFNNDFNEENTCTIKVNGAFVNVPYFRNTTNTSYPSYNNNGILTLGVFKDETVKVELTYTSSENIPSGDTSSFALMPLDKLQAVCDAQYAYGDYAKAGFASLSIKKTVTDTTHNMLLIPTYHDSGWSCTVNSQPCEIKTAINGFMCIELSEGENTIELSFTPVGFRAGLLISLIALILTLALIIFYKFKPFKVSAVLGKLFTGIFYAASGFVFLTVYVLLILVTLLFV